MEIPLYFWFELLALLVCLVFLKKNRHTMLFYFIPYLLLIVIYEFGTLKGWFTINKSNLWAVNIITTIEFIFNGLILVSLMKKKRAKNIALCGLLFIFGLTVLNIFFFQGFNKLHTYTFLLGCALLIINSCYFFYELLDYSNNENSILKKTEFWIATGILFFYLGQFAFFCFFEYMMFSKDIRYRILFDNISNFSNAILYTCIIIAVLCKNKKVQKLL
jgi:hypothetical protein